MVENYLPINVSEIDNWFAQVLEAGFGMAGNFVQMEQPERVNKSIVRFLKDL